MAIRRHARAGGVPTQAWLERLPHVAARCAERWSLHLGDVFPTSHSLVIAATREDGTPAVLKLAYPERENDDEAEGLRRWSGRGAVRLLEHDRAERALLLERIEPGTPLDALPIAEADPIATRLAPRLWLEVEADHPFERVDTLAAAWAQDLPRLYEAGGRRCSATLLEAAIATFRALGPTQRRAVLLHRDFHGGNALRSGDGWRFIDPKPIVGEPEFDVSWYLGDRRGETTPATAAGRLEFATAELGLDRERLRRWTVARYVLGGLWSYEDGGDGAWAIAVAHAYAAVAPAPAGRRRPDPSRRPRRC